MSVKVYISGAMASRPETYRKAFAAAEAKLKKAHPECVVINPAVLPEGLNHEQYMPLCLAMLDAADIILMLNGWERSAGAKLEKAYADYQGKLAIYENEILWQSTTNG